MGSNLELIKKLKTDLASRFRMTDLDPTVHYLGMEITYIDNSILVTRMVEINQFLASHQMTNCNITTTLIVKGLYLLPTVNDFIPNNANIITYKLFIESVQ